jgi:hypothetical protein
MSCTELTCARVRMNARTHIHKEHDGEKVISGQCQIVHVFPNISLYLTSKYRENKTEKCGVMYTKVGGGGNLQIYN